MPSRLRQLVPDLVDLGGDIAGNLLNRRTASRAGDTLRTSIDAQGRLISDASQRGITGEEDALRRQEELYRTRRADFDPYAQGGAEGVSALRKLVADNPTFDVSKVTEDPGYKFGMDEGLKQTQRILSSRGTLNSGQSKAFIRYANDYATTKVGEARNAFNTDQQARLNRINALTGVGEFGATGQANAAGDFGDQVGRSATNRSALALSEAEALANLEGQRGDVNFGQELASGNANQGLLGAGISAGTSLLQKALGIGGTAAAGAGAAAGVGAGAAGTAGAAGGATAGTTAGASTAAGGGLGSTMAALATNPITIGVAGALAAGAIWLKSQAHWEANTAVKDLENPFHQNTLAPFAAQWDAAIKGGKLNAQQGHAALDQYTQNFDDYITKIQQWAGNSKDKKKVAEQSIANLYKTTVKPQLTRMTGEIAGLPA